MRIPQCTHGFGGEDSKNWRENWGEVSMGCSRAWLPHPATELNSKCQLNISSWSLAKGCRCSGSLPPCHVSSLGKALPWQGWGVKLSLFLLPRSEIINQSSPKGAGRALGCSTPADNEGHKEMPPVTLASIAAPGRRVSPLLLQEHPGTPECWLQAQPEPLHGIRLGTPLAISPLSSVLLRSSRSAHWSADFMVF